MTSGERYYNTRGIVRGERVERTKDLVRSLPAMLEEVHEQEGQQNLRVVVLPQVTNYLRLLSIRSEVNSSATQQSSDGRMQEPRFSHLTRFPLQ
jgi:hypothetical protein